MDLAELASLIKEKQTSLFIGAGFSMDSTGPRGNHILNELKSYFGDSDIQDSFLYLDNVIGYDTDIRKEVENKLTTYFRRIEYNKNHKYLLSISWTAVLTTNYDHIPDEIRNSLDGNREIEIIVKKEDRVDVRKKEKLFCFKLFGDFTYKYPEDGYMILTNEDRRQAISRLEPFFKIFKEIAMLGNIIYLGYSFQDQLVYELLSDLAFSWKQIPWKGYAISPNEPSMEKLQHLNKFNVEWIEGDVSRFVVELKNIFGAIPISHTMENKMIILDNIGFNVSKETILNCRNNISFLHESLLEPLFENPKYFYEGTDKSFFPYYKKWDIKRIITPYSINKKSYSRYDLDSYNYVKERLFITSFTNNIKTVLMGNAGSGKSTIANRIAYNWYINGGPVIFIEPNSYRIDQKTIKGFIDEVIIKYEKRRNEQNLTERSLRFLLVADNCSVFIDNIIDIYDFFTSNGYLVDLLIVERKSKILPKFDQYMFDSIFEISETLYEEDHRILINHFNRINLKISEELLLSNIKNKDINESFFALMYTTIKETQKPLKRIIIDEYASLEDDCKLIYSLVSLMDSLGVKPHISLISKYSDSKTDWLIDNINNGKLTGIIKKDMDGYLYTNHLIISEIIDKYEFTSTLKYFTIFNNIVDKVTKGNDIEEEFIHDLLINRIKYPTFDIRVNRNKIIELYLKILEKFQTRPLYHHLSIHYLHANDYESGKYYIKKSYNTYHPKFHGREQSLMDTEGRLELSKAKECIENKKEDEAWRHLDLAESYFENAVTDIFSSPHPIQGLAQTYYHKGILSEDNAKFNFCLIALSKIRHLNKNIEQSRYHSYEIERNILSEIDPFINEYSSKNIAELFKNPDGYAYLAEKEMEEKNYKKALKLINDGLSTSGSIWLLTLKIESLKKLNPNNLDVLNETLEQYQKLGEYDLKLSFELAKYLFYSMDYYKSYQEFNQLKINSERYYGKLGYHPDNILFEQSDPITFKGILTQLPNLTTRGIVKCYDLPKEIRDFSVRYYDINFQGAKENNPVNFNVYFNYTGPQAMNVTKR